MTQESEHHAQVAAQFTALVDATIDWTSPTPVPEWQARHVVEHLLDWLPYVVDAWTGVSLTDDIGAQLPQRWRSRAFAVQSLLEDPTSAATQVTAGPFTGDRLAPVLDRIYTADVYMHSWDLARATGQALTLDSDHARDLLAGMRGMEQVIRGSGQFGPPQPTSSTAPVDRLMAFIGRDPQWRP